MHNFVHFIFVKRKGYTTNAPDRLEGRPGFRDASTPEVVTLPGPVSGRAMSRHKRTIKNQGQCDVQPCTCLISFPVLCIPFLRCHHAKRACLSLDAVAYYRVADVLESVTASFSPTHLEIQMASSEEPKPTQPLPSRLSVSLATLASGQDADHWGKCT